VPTTILRSGLQITVPSDYKVSPGATTADSQRRSPITRPTGPVPLLTSTDDLSREHDAIIQALEQQEMQLFDSASVEPEPSEARRGVAGAGEPADKAELSMEVEPYESAVVLLEQDGFYSWTFPTETQAVVSGKNVRGARTSAPKRRLVFRIDVPSAKSPSAGPSRRGFVKDFVFARIRAFVFKFAAQVMVEHGMRFLERNVRKGIVRISAADPAQWSALQDLSSLQFAQNRPARILLFVHGTFSNTVGAFGALGSSPWGKAWLEAALANYDAILGFDHPTLSENPLENATDLLQELEKVSWAQPPHFDVVVHSRGALVFRSLVENLLPSSPWQAYFDRVVFVAGTNGGTQLAEPRNWQQMIDLYTNLAVAACRLIGMMPQAKAVALVLKESIQGIGAFLKYSATTAVTERKVPGLAAMEPDGEFVKDLNRSQPGRPTVATTYYCAITSSFVPQLTDGQPRPKELPVRLVSWILEVLAKEIMKQPNDLVVNTSAMTAIELEVGNFIKDKLDFGENPEVYHTNYFTRPEVVNALANWLNLAKPAPPAVREIKTSGRVRKSRGGGSGHIRIGGSKSEGGNKTKSHDPASGPVFAGTIYHNWIDAGGMALPPRAAALDTDFIVRDAADPIANVVAAIEKIAPSYVVLRRPWYGETLDYAFSAEEILAHPKAKTSMSLMDALDLHETDRSPNLSAFEPLLRPVRGGAPTSGRAVVLARDRPVGVLPDSVSLTNNIDLIDLARLTGSAKITDRIFTRRAMPTLLIAEPLDIPASKSKVGTFACHFHAEMDDEVVLKHVTTVEVLLSREVIERSIHAAAASSSAKVEADRKLIVQVIPRVNFETVDTSRIEVDPPAPDAPQTLMFDVRPTHTGKGEIWVVIRQGPVPLATLSLRPNIVETKARENRRTSSSADTAEAEKVPGPLHQLFITEQRNGDQVSYFYQLQSPDLGLLEWTNTKPFIGDRKKYVDGIYKEIEQRWLSSHSDVETFTQDLRAYGAQLLDELIPKELQVTLWEHRDQLKSIMVISTEPFIPWELVHLKDPAKGMPPDLRFLGQMGLVRWLHQAGWPPDVVKIRKGKVRYVVPDYPHPDYVLAEAAKEPLFLKKEFQATAVTPQPNDVRDLLQQPGAFDLLHFACHGFAESDNISNAQLMLQGRVEGGKYLPAYLSATTAAQFSNLKTTENRPMIVLNACQAARAGYTLTGVGGFAQAFINAGAGCFVSSLWSVGDQPARTFTETLYSELLRSRKLSDAAIEARKKAKNAGDATWLAYAVYGHPYMKVRRT
jgi:hypothetical protein